MLALQLSFYCATRRCLKLKLRFLKLRLRLLSFLGGKWLGEILGRGVIAKVEAATATATAATRLQLSLHNYVCTIVSAHVFVQLFLRI